VSGLIFLPQILTLLWYKKFDQRTYHLQTSSFIDRMNDFGWEALHNSGLTFFLAGALVLIHVPRVRRALLLPLGILALVAIDTSSWGNFYREDFIADLELRQLIFTLQPLTVCAAFAGLAALRDSPRLRVPYVIFGGIALLHYVKTYRHMPLNPLVLLNVLVTGFILLHLLGKWETRIRSFVVRWKRPIQIGIIILLLGAIRILRICSYCMENVPYYEWFGEDPGWTRIVNAHHERPGRTVTLGFFASAALSRGLETADVLTAIFYQGYKDYWGLIIDPQLESPEDRKYFDAYYYSLCLLNGPSLTKFDTATPEFELKVRWTLLEAANVTHIISTRPLDQLQQRSAKTWVIPEKPSPEHWLEEPVSKVPESFLEKISLYPLGDRSRYFSPRKLWIYELRGAFDRGYLVEDQATFTTDSEILEGLASASREDLQRKVFLQAAEARATAVPPPSRRSLSSFAGTRRCRA
jgi:hypothetical protein